VVGVLSGGKPVESKPMDDNALEFITQPDGIYELTPRNP
jgi:hypothetical protein